MKSNLTKKLLSICGDAHMTYGCSDNEGITRLTEEQRIQVEAELIKHFEFDKIVWIELDINRLIPLKSMKISDSDNPTYKHKVGYFYTVSFTPKMYEPNEIYKPVKDGCVFGPILYNPETFEPFQSITLTWSPEFPQVIGTYQDDKQMIRDMLEKVLENPEEYKPKGHVGCLVRFSEI